MLDSEKGPKTLKKGGGKILEMSPYKCFTSLSYVLPYIGKVNAPRNGAGTPFQALDL
jgi:hypothetical protein